MVWSEISLIIVSGFFFLHDLRICKTNGNFWYLQMCVGKSLNTCKNKQLHMHTLHDNTTFYIKTFTLSLCDDFCAQKASCAYKLLNAGLCKLWCAWIRLHLGRDPLASFKTPYMASTPQVYKYMMHVSADRKR